MGWDMYTDRYIKDAKYDFISDNVSEREYQEDD
jgi:hypothetical protein